MDKAYMYFKFKCFGDAYTALNNTFAQGESMDYVSYYYMCDNVTRLNIVEASRDGKTWDKIDKLIPTEEDKKYGWLSNDGIKIDRMEPQGSDTDFWIFTVPGIRSFDGIVEGGIRK